MSDLANYPAAKFLETHLDEMVAGARAHGWEVIVCNFSGLHVPVLKVIADQLSLVADQELSTEQMMTITRGMELLQEGREWLDGRRD